MYVRSTEYLELVYVNFKTIADHTNRASRNIIDSVMHKISRQVEFIDCGLLANHHIFISNRATRTEQVADFMLLSGWSRMNEVYKNNKPFLFKASIIFQPRS